jgi:hypothetical protein
VLFRHYAIIISVIFQLRVVNVPIHESNSGIT